MSVGIIPEAYDISLVFKWYKRPFGEERLSTLLLC